MIDDKDRIDKTGSGHDGIEGLNNTQIILLTLLISFVTSIATGIVTVTLMDQAPPGVTQTINRVVEKTIEKAVPGEPQIIEKIQEVKTASRDEQIIVAIEKNLASLATVVSVRENATSTTQTGFFVSASGYFVTSGTLDKDVRYTVRTGDGKEYQSKIEKIDEEYDFTLLKAGRQIGAGTLEAIADAVSPGKFSFIDPSPYTAKLGQTVVALGRTGRFGNSVTIGVVTGVTNATTTRRVVETDIEPKRENLGGPVIDLTGVLVGLITEQETVPASVVGESLREVISAGGFGDGNTANIDSSI